MLSNEEEIMCFLTVDQRAAEKQILGALESYFIRGMDCPFVNKDVQDGGD